MMPKILSMMEMEDDVDDDYDDDETVDDVNVCMFFFSSQPSNATTVRRGNHCRITAESLPNHCRIAALPRT